MATKWTSRAPFETDGQLWISAFDRRQFYHQATNIDPFGGDILNFFHFGPGAPRNHQKRKEIHAFLLFFNRVRAEMDEFQIVTTKWINIGRLVIKMAPIES